jgi:hypothetical protein
MKFDLLATKDEIIVRDLFPIVVSNRRVYVCSGSRTRYSRSYIKRIIEIESITSVRFQLTKNPFLKFMAFLCLIISILGASLAAYSYITTKSFTGDLFLYGAIGFGVGLLLFILFLIAYFKKRKKIIWIEYPSNFAHPTKVIYERIQLKDFEELVTAIFEAKDKLKAPVASPFTTKQDVLF